MVLKLFRKNKSTQIKYLFNENYKVLLNLTQLYSYLNNFRSKEHKSLYPCETDTVKTFSKAK